MLTVYRYETQNLRNGSITLYLVIQILIHYVRQQMAVMRYAWMKEVGEVACKIGSYKMCSGSELQCQSFGLLCNKIILTIWNSDFLSWSYIIVHFNASAAISFTCRGNLLQMITFLRQANSLPCVSYHMTWSFFFNALYSTIVINKLRNF